MTQGHRLHAGSASRSRSLSVLFALSLLFALLPFAGGALAQTADDEPDGRFENTVELEAAGSVDAAIAWSQFTFDDGSVDTAMIGRSDKFPDNLASSLIQGQEDAPLLLTPTNALDDDVAAELERLGVQTVHILGGDAAISDAVEDELQAAGYTTHRDSGITRIETAIDIAQTHAPNATQGLLVRAFGGPSGDETQAWADALAGGAWAADAGLPVFLTQTDQLTDSLRDYLEDSDITSLTVLGGTAAISESVVTELESMGIDVNRVSGPNRFATAVAIAEARGFSDPSEAGSIILVEGQASNAWASGFAAAAYADLTNGIVLLSNGANLPPETEAYLQGTDADNDGVNDEFETQAAGDVILVCGPFVDPEACAAAAALLGFDEVAEGAQTFLEEAPELVAAEMGSSDEDDNRQNVIFTFDEEVNDNAVSAGQFVLYQYDADPIFGDDFDVDGNQVEVEFLDFDGAQLATVAAVRPGAVQDEDGNENIEASVPLQDVDLGADETEGPEITDVELDAGDNTATFVFDEEVDTDVTTTGDFGLVDEEGNVYDDFNPAAITVNEDEDEVTITFIEDFTDEDEIVRAFMLEDAVTGDDGESSAPQSFDLEGDPEDSPRLIGATVELGDDDDDDDDNDDDTVVYRFSEAVDVAGVANDFFVVTADGDVIRGDAVDNDDTENNRVEIEFTDENNPIDESVVRAGIDPGAVDEEGAGGQANVGTQTVEVDGASFEAGRTTAPDPLSITVEEDTDSFGNVDGFVITIDFDEDLASNGFDDTATQAYEEDGSESSEDPFNDCEIDDDDESIVTCEVDEDDVEDVAALALQQGAATDEDGNESYEFSAEFPNDDNA